MRRFFVSSVLRQHLRIGKGISVQGSTRRNRLEVLAEILSLCKSPRQKTHLLQKVNLSYPKLQDCLQQLRDLKMVNLQPQTSDYVTTEKGLLFLIKWLQLKEFLDPEEKILMTTKRVYNASGSIIILPSSRGRYDTLDI
jgi:predicted transcriptional regulator